MTEFTAMSAICRAALNRPQRHLLDLMHELHFGAIEQLIIRHAQPCFTPPPRLVREFKFGGTPESKLELGGKDFLLKRQHLELLDTIRQLGDGLIERLEIRHGLPQRLWVTTSPRNREEGA
ncbi:MAG: hypothetical protein HJJLKODD_02676 [Phycisphaerae bacterium]|nr:hypothetical protein [Phycisphaerae bacterium]